MSWRVSSLATAAKACYERSFMPVLEKVHRQHKDLGFLMIAIWKLGRAVLFVGVALWALAGVHENCPETAVCHTIGRWLHWLRLGGSHEFVREFLIRHGIMQERSMELICTVSGVYSLKLFIEGFGLWFETKWAPYLVITLTTAFIPAEIYGVARQPSWSWQAALVVNLVVVGYLAFRLVQTSMGDKARQLRVLSRMKLFYASVASLATVSFLDYVTGSEFFFFLFYVIPVALYAWYSNLRTTVAAAMISGIVWWFTDWAGGHHYPHQWFGYWNAFVCFLSFTAVGFALNVIRRHEDSLRKSTRQYLDALEEIRMLKAQLNQAVPQGPAANTEGREGDRHRTSA
jgi:uncharacterized membrane protein (DUF2068 family)